MTWNKHMLKGSFWDPKRKDIHPANREIKKLMRQSGLTQKMASETLRIPLSRLRKDLNSWYPLPEWLRQQLLALIQIRCRARALTHRNRDKSNI